MSTTSKNLGQVAAVIAGITPPDNTNLIWLDTSGAETIKKVYNPTNTAWEPLMKNDSTGADNWGTQVIVSSIEFAGNGTTANELKLASQDAQIGYVLKWDGTSWKPAVDNIGSGLQAVSIGSEFKGDGTVGAPIGLRTTGVAEGQIMKFVSGQWQPANDDVGVRFIKDMVILWKGSPSAVPDGWEILQITRGRVVVGFDQNDADFNKMEKTGGVKEVRLTADQNGPHIHGVNDEGHDHTMKFGNDQGGNAHAANWAKLDGSNNERKTTNSKTGITIQSSGLGAAHTNLQPYVVLAYIIYKG